MRRFYIWAIILVISGLVICIYLFPSREDIALIFLRGKKYTAAESYYKEQYNRGERSSDVIIGLQSLELKEGDIHGAIDLITEYLRAHPNDPYALQLLADLYLSNQEYEKYNEVLEEIRQTKPDKTNLQALAKYL